MYQFQIAAVPRLPPVIPSVVAEPLQIGDVPVALVAGEEKVFTVIVVLTQVVVLQVPEAST